MLDYLSVPFLIEKYKTFNENFGEKNSSSEELTDLQYAFLIFIFIIAVLIVAALYYWALTSLITFNIPVVIVVLCTIFLLIGNPIYAIIFAYLFKDKLTI